MDHPCSKNWHLSDTYTTINNTPVTIDLFFLLLERNFLTELVVYVLRLILYRHLV